MKSATILSALKKLRVLLTRQEKMQWLRFSIFAFCSGGLEIMTTLAVILFARILNDPAHGFQYFSRWVPNTGISTTHFIFYAVLLLGLMYVLKNGFAVFETFYQNLTIQRMSAQFKNRLLTRYAQLDYGFFLTRNSSEGLNVITGEVDRVFSMGLIPLAGILSEGIVVLGLLSVLVYIKPSLALIVFGLGLVLVFALTKYVFPLFYRWGNLIQQESLSSFQALMQFFHAFKEMVLLGKQAAFIKICQNHIDKQARVQGLQSATNTLPRALIEVMFMGFLVGTIALLCLAHESPAKMMMVLSGYLYAGFRLMPAVNRILGYFNVFKSQIPVIDRLFLEYQDLPLSQYEEDSVAFEFNQSIELKQVSFTYRNSSHQALQQVTLSISKGECLGIIGTTGSGKSTLVDVILGLLNPNEGTVLIDGQFSVRSKQWHQQLAYVPQAIYLVDNTIEANIAFGEEQVDAQRLHDALEAAQLAELIEKLPQGIHTLVGERGVRLSGGERQRIAIARALYQNPAVLIFDEATSALDTQTESRLMETIYQISEHRTVIMIAHRLSTLQRCDRVVKMEGGMIVDITDYASLQGSQDSNNATSIVMT